MTTVQDKSHLKFADPSMARAQVRKLTLANGIRVYLLHDPTARTDAVACGVRAGGWQDPEDAPGMAHFVEHLLFMGTADYPDEADFYAFLARHGGNTNAYTTVDRTVYMYDVEPGGLPGSMRRFGAFFKRPLFREESIARERHAVDQEYRAKSRVDGWREVMVDVALSGSEHPNRHYHVGTLQSLVAVDRAAMTRWFQEHYSSHLMDVVVRGSQSLDALQAAVVEGFSDVPRRDIAVPRINAPMLDPALAASTAVIEPVRASTRELELKWDLPMGPDDKAGARACELLAYLLDNQGRNSLLARLRDLGLADDISILPRHFASGRTLLTVSFDVTDRGVAQRDTIIGLLFATLREVGDLRRLQPLMRELQQQTWRRYAYQNPGPGYDAVAKTADQMLTERLDTFPDLDDGAFDVSARAWGALLHQLEPGAAHATLLAPFALAGVASQKPVVEPRMQVRYVLVPRSVPASIASVDEGFGVPAANPWMPQNLTVAGNDGDAPTLDNPLHLVDDAYASVYVARDKQLTNPRISLMVDVKTPYADPADAPAEALYDLWWQAAEDGLQDLRNEAEGADLHLKVERVDSGVRIALHGLNDKAPKLLDVVLRRLTHLASHASPERFEQLRTRLTRMYDDQAGARPRDVAYGRLFDWRMERTYGAPEKKAALQVLTAADLAVASQQIFAQVYTEASLFGNVEVKTAYQCYAAINRHLRHTLYANARLPASRRGREMMTLAEPARLYVANAATRGNAVVIQLCEGEDTPSAKAASAVLGHALEPEFFDVLRTRQQLAYSLSTAGISRDGELFRTFAVSPFHCDAHTTAQRVDAFVRQFAASLDIGGISEEAFAAYKSAVRRQWTTDLSQVGAGNERLHWLAFDKRGDFLLVQRRIEALDRLDYATFLRYARRALTTHHRVEVWVDGGDAAY